MGHCIKFYWDMIYMAALLKGGGGNPSLGLSSHVSSSSSFYCLELPSQSSFPLKTLSFSLLVIATDDEL